MIEKMIGKKLSIVIHKANINKTYFISNAININIALLNQIVVCFL